MRHRVHVVDQRDYSVKAVRDRVGAVLEEDRVPVRGATVFVKPSFVYPARPPRNRGVNTQPEVVAGVARALRDLGARRVLVGEDCLLGPSECGFVAMGVLPLLRGVAEPVYLQNEERVAVRVERPFVEERFALPRRLVEADLFVSLPKLKTNMHSLVTLAAKNHLGLLLQDDRLTHHDRNLHEKLADLYRARPADYVVTDAVVAGAGQGPMHAREVPVGVLIASANALAADTVSCALMGISPREVRYLALLNERGLGPLALDEIEVRGEGLLAERGRRFDRPRSDFAQLPPGARVVCGPSAACPEGCAGMLRGSLEPHMARGRKHRLDGWTFILGKGPIEVPRDLDPRRTLVVGDCAAEHRAAGRLVPGCPPRPMAITGALLQAGVLGRIEMRYRDMLGGLLLHALEQGRAACRGGVGAATSRLFGRAR